MKAPTSLMVTCVGCESPVSLALINASEDMTHYEEACPRCGMFVLLSFSPPKATTHAVMRQVEDVMRTPTPKRQEHGPPE